MTTLLRTTKNQLDRTDHYVTLVAEMPGNRNEI